MYRRPKFLEVLLKIREEMAREADYDVDFFVEMVRNRMQPATDVRHALTDRDSDAADRSRPSGRMKKK
ncbi:MAG TPA: hypothetical protein VGJ02_07735 [Pyrinomonadaceae bacterium]|jgi:hypothetical protein